MRKTLGLLSGYPNLKLEGFSDDLRHHPQPCYRKFVQLNGRQRQLYNDLTDSGYGNIKRRKIEIVDKANISTLLNHQALSNGPTDDNIGVAAVNKSKADVNEPIKNSTHSTDKNKHSQTDRMDVDADTETSDVERFVNINLFKKKFSVFKKNHESIRGDQCSFLVERVSKKFINFQFMHRKYNFSYRNLCREAVYIVFPPKMSFFKKLCRKMIFLAAKQRE